MTIQQQAYFFELLQKLGYDKNEAKEHAKKRYNKEHFLQLSSQEIGELIEILIAECSPNTTTPEGFPGEYKIWDTQEHTMKYGTDALNVLNLQKERWQVLWYTGKLDTKGNKIYDLDIILSVLNKKYVVQYSTKDCAWVGYDTISGETILLSSFGKLSNLGSTYEGN